MRENSVNARKQEFGLGGGLAGRGRRERDGHYEGSAFCHVACPRLP